MKHSQKKSVSAIFWETPLGTPVQPKAIKGSSGQQYSIANKYNS